MIAPGQALPHVHMMICCPGQALPHVHMMICCSGATLPRGKFMVIWSLRNYLNFFSFTQTVTENEF